MKKTLAERVIEKMNPRIETKNGYPSFAVCFENGDNTVEIGCYTLNEADELLSNVKWAIITESKNYEVAAV